jgi:hypothetical protein
MLSVTFPAGQNSYRVIKVLPPALDHEFLRLTAGLPPFIKSSAAKVTFVGPVRGGGAGGAVVNISGSGFTLATRVNFGLNAATRFTVNNDSSITAIAPPGVGTVAVSVTTPAGTSPTGVASTLSQVDSEFETGIGGWRGYQNGVLATTNVSARTGTHSLRITPQVDGTETAATARYAVTPNSPVMGTLWALSPSGENRVRAWIAFYDLGGALISLVKGRVVGTSDAVWRQVEVSANSPRNAVSVSIGFEDISPRGPVYLDGASLVGSNQFTYRQAGIRDLQEGDSADT